MARSGYLGMDTDGLREVGGALTTCSEDVERVLADLDGLVEVALEHWSGTDADRFRDTWRARHRPALSEVTRVVGQFGQEAVREAATQDEASR